MKLKIYLSINSLLVDREYNNHNTINAIYWCWFTSCPSQSVFAGELVDNILGLISMVSICNDDSLSSSSSILDCLFISSSKCLYKSGIIKSFDLKIITITLDYLLISNFGKKARINIYNFFYKLLFSNHITFLTQNFNGKINWKINILKN